MFTEEKIVDIHADGQRDIIFFYYIIYDLLDV